MKMPCTKNEDQEQDDVMRVTFRSRFNQNQISAGLRYSDQQNMHSFAILAPHQHQHQHQHHNPPIAPQPSAASNQRSSSNNQEDLTEQIRISVRDTHISQHGSSDDEVVAGNISDDLDSMEESYLAYYNNLHQQGFLEDHNSSGLVVSNIVNSRTINQATPYIPLPSTSTSTSPSTSPVAVPSTAEVVAAAVTAATAATPTTAETTVATASTTASASTAIPVTVALRPKATSSPSQNRANRPQNQQRPSNTGRARRSRRIVALSGKECNNDHTEGIERTVSTHQHQNKNCRDLTDTKDKRSEAQRSKSNASSSNQRKQKKQLPPWLVSIECPSIEISPILKSIPATCKQVGFIRTQLFDGSSFSGQQNSRNESYDVNVKIQHVDYDNSYLNGYLCIAHLTKTHPTLTTFFEGEIISERYPFLTRKWEATKEIDRAHWSKFEGFSNDYLSDSFNYDELKKSDHIYMRWKELFLVPDHTIKNVEGASYAGFYYVCFSKRTSRIKGYYFHIAEHFERFQSLDLGLDCKDRTSQVYEFR